MFGRGNGFLFAVVVVLGWPLAASAQTLSGDAVKVKIGTNGEISSLQIVQDAFPTEYVMNAQNATGQNTDDHAWVGELMLSYRMGSGAWTPAFTSRSGDVRKITAAADKISVSYQGSSDMQGIRNIALTETYATVPGGLSWTIELSNPGSSAIEIGDLGLPLPFNEYWGQREQIYETRTLYHSFTGQNSSYVRIGRPSGVGPLLVMIPDATTGAGFEYMDNWRPEEHMGSAWAAGGGMPKWSNGLDVFYVHSAAIASTGRGYLPNTSLMLGPGDKKAYAFKILKVTDLNDLKDRLYKEGLIDMTVVPGMIFATDMTAEFDLHTSKPIVSVTPQYPSETQLTPLTNADPDHHIYALQLSHLGPNAITVSYGAGEQTTLQFYAIEAIDKALQRHATFMVEHTVSQTASDPLYRVFDDWMMDSKARRGMTGSWGWGDDWGWTHGQFLAEKNAQTPVAAEVQALDDYLAAVFGSQIDSRTYSVSDWFCPSSADSSCHYDRAFAYPHVINTYYSMSKIAALYPTLIKYKQTADAYLLTAYKILNAMYASPATMPVTGYMGEQILPELADALKAANHTTEANAVLSIVSNKYNAFQGNAYPYGSEYNYDNTGEEAVYMAAKVKKDEAMMAKVDAKTRACRGQAPVWYYYADPITLNGENWWQFQYSVALIGFGMDDWVRGHSKTPELDERLAYAAKVANVGAINSGQIDAAPENIGTVAWTYQASKGNVYIGTKADSGMLHNGWRQMSGESDLGLWGALRLLSSDVSVDPLFGLYCYGCEVAEQSMCYRVVPHDGVGKRLNLITQKLHVELDRDRYEGATLGTERDYVSLDIVNQTGDAHATKITMQGLAAGLYPVTIDGASMGNLMVSDGQAATWMMQLGAEPKHTLQIGTRCQGIMPMTMPPGAAGAGAAAPTTGVGAAAGSGGAGARSTTGSAGNRAGGPTTAGGAGTSAAAGAGSSTPASMAASDAGPAAAKGCGCQLARGSERTPLMLVALGLVILALRARRRYLN